MYSRQKRAPKKKHIASGPRERASGVCQRLPASSVGATAEPNPHDTERSATFSLSDICERVAGLFFVCVFKVLYYMVCVVIVVKKAAAEDEPAFWFACLKKVLRDGIRLIGIDRKRTMIK